MNSEISYEPDGSLPELANPCIECPFRVDTIKTWEDVKMRRRRCSAAEDAAEHKTTQTCHMTDLTHVCRGAQIFNGVALDTLNVVKKGISIDFNFHHDEGYFE